jgi:hypothetical protein
MKLCPQCDFIYEDDQRFCDMDGKELVYASAPIVDETTVATSVTPTPELLAEPRSRGVAAAVIVVVVLTALVVVLYVVRARQTRSRAASEASTRLRDRSAGQSPVKSTSEARPTGSDLISTEAPVANNELPPELRADSSSQIETASTSQSQTSQASLAHARLVASPVSAGAATGNNRGSVIVRLNNGASIKADEAWEKKEGVWYRQAGMVTFLKRGSVRSIDRVAPAAQSKPVANTSGDKSKKNAASQNQLRLAQLEPVETKKPSRFNSFLKKTGRLLKNPFKM